MSFQQVSELLRGQYELSKELGSGGFATVFQATQRSTGQIVALKVQKLDAAWTEHQSALRRARFERETALCAMLSHPHIVRMLDKGQVGQYLYLVFEYVPGDTLAFTLAKEGALEPPEAVSLMGQVLDALDAAHSCGVVHRDLKPENLMVVSTGTGRYLKVLDFGAGAFIENAASDVSRLTHSTEILGTPSYSSPEQLRGEPATPKSDIYAWGLVLLECLTGRRVIEGATVAEIFQKQLSPLAIQLPPELATHPLGDVLRRALKKSPDERASDARRLWAELRQVPLTGLISPASATRARSPRTVAVRSPYGRGEQRQASVLSCSLSAFATSSAASDIETLDAIQRDQMNLCADIITRFGGFVAGMLANRIVAVFGLPHASDNDARLAARAALEIISRVSSRRAVLTSRRGIDVEVRIGLNTGLVLVGADGSPSGPALNVAARLESIASPGTALVGELTYELLENQLKFRAVPGAAAPGGAGGRVFLLLPEEPAAGPVAGTFGRRPLVGREDEFESLTTHWANARSGNGRVVLLKGEAGIGKSRLAHELCARVAASGGEVVKYRCLPEESHTALHAILPVVRERFAVMEAPGGFERLERELAARGLDPTQLLPIFGAWLMLPNPTAPGAPGLSAERQKALLLEALAKLLCPLPDEPPRLVVLEDLHWSDATTRELLSRLAPTAVGCRVLFLLTARPEFQLGLDCHVCRLQALSSIAVDKLIADSAGDVALDPESIRQIHERADGIPLFVEELTRSLVDARRRTGSDPSRLEPVPATLRDLLVGRLDRLGEAKRTAQLAAAIGREFSFELLRAVSTRSDEALKADLDLLSEAQLVRSVHGAEYEFRHVLIREAASDSMLASHRRAVHRAIALALESLPPGSPEAAPARLAWHFELAAMPEKAFSNRLAAGMRAAGMSAYQEAIAHLEHAKRLLPEFEKTDHRYSCERDLCGVLGGVLVATQGFATDAVVDVFTRSQELLRVGTPSPEQRLMTLKGLWTFHNARADYRVAQQLSEELLALAAEQGTAEAYLVAYDCACQTAVLTGRFRRALECGEEARRWFDLELQRALTAKYGIDPGLTADSFASIASAMLGDVDVARRRLTKIVQTAEEIGAPSLRSAMLGQAALVDFYVGSCGPRPNAVLRSCIDHAERALGIARRYGFPFWENFAAMIRIMADALEPAKADFLSSAEQAIEGWRLSGTRACRSWHAAGLALGQHARGLYGPARANALAALEHCRETGEGYAESEAHRVIGIVLSDPGNPERDTERAIVEFTEAIDVAGAQEARWLELRAAYSFVRHVPAAGSLARSRLERVLGWFLRENQATDTALVQAARLALETPATAHSPR